jgi:hypothetical protein
MQLASSSSNLPFRSLSYAAQRPRILSRDSSLKIVLMSKIDPTGGHTRRLQLITCNVTSRNSVVHRPESIRSVFVHAIEPPEVLTLSSLGFVRTGEYVARYYQRNEGPDDGQTCVCDGETWFYDCPEDGVDHTSTYFGE